MDAKVRVLCLTESYVVEQDPTQDENQYLSIHPIQDILTILIYLEDSNKFSIEYKNDKTYTYTSDHRDLIISNLLDIYFRKLGIECMLTIQECYGGFREGVKGTLPSVDYQDILFKRLATIEKADAQEVNK